MKSIVNSKFKFSLSSNLTRKINLTISKSIRSSAGIKNEFNPTRMEIVNNFLFKGRCNRSA